MATTTSERRARTYYRSPSRDKILDAAEIEFASNSYDSCSLRMIAESSGVNLGLLHYYFGSKQALFSAVFLRRAKKLVERRMELLTEAKREAGDTPIQLETLVRCFIKPTIEMIKQGEGPRAFIRLHSRLRTEPLDFARELRRTAFNEANIAFIEAFHAACPELTRATVVWRFTAMVGAYLFLISQSGRVEDLSKGLCDPADVDTAIEEVVPFCVGGFLSPEPNIVPARKTKKKKKTGRRKSA